MGSFGGVSTVTDRKEITMSRTQDDRTEELTRPVEGGEEGRQSGEPQVKACPICGVVVVGSGPLRSHVLNSEDPEHRHQRLDEELEPVTVWSEVDWSPGPPS